MRSRSSRSTIRCWSARAAANSRATLAWPAKPAAMLKSGASNSARPARRAIVSAPSVLAVPSSGYHHHRTVLDARSSDAPFAPATPTPPAASTDARSSIAFPANVSREREPLAQLPAGKVADRKFHDDLVGVR